MPPDEHDFNSSFAVGRDGEEFLDKLFSIKFTIEQVDREDQRRGIDRYFTGKSEDAKRLAIEYKTDHRAADTGNAFIETVSVDSADKEGWAYKSQADYLIYYLPEDGLIYSIRMSALRRCLDRWAQEYPTRAAPNKGYNTYGILVPLHEFEDIAELVITC
jgi:hypothetical protein